MQPSIPDDVLLEQIIFQQSVDVTWPSMLLKLERNQWRRSGSLRRKNTLSGGCLLKSQHDAEKSAFGWNI